eukprot:6213454-Pleurochrysis_carterae.AAC.5
MTASSVSGSAGGLKATAARVLFEESEQMIIDRLQDFDANFNEQARCQHRPVVARSAACSRLRSFSMMYLQLPTELPRD